MGKNLRAVKNHTGKGNKWQWETSLSHCKVLQQGTDKNDPHKALCSSLLGLKVQQRVVGGRWFLVRRV